MAGITALPLGGPGAHPNLPRGLFILRPATWIRQQLQEATRRANDFLVAATCSPAGVNDDGLGHSDSL